MEKLSFSKKSCRIADPFNIAKNRIVCLLSVSFPGNVRDMDFADNVNFNCMWKCYEN